jgi:multimeric flavodoxin WrbA
MTMKDFLDRLSVLWAELTEEQRKVIAKMIAR